MDPWVRANGAGVYGRIVEELQNNNHRSFYLPLSPARPPFPRLPLLLCSHFRTVLVRAVDACDTVPIFGRRVGVPMLVKSLRIGCPFRQASTRKVTFRVQWFRNFSGCRCRRDLCGSRKTWGGRSGKIQERRVPEAGNR